TMDQTNTNSDQSTASVVSENQPNASITNQLCHGTDNSDQLFNLHPSGMEDFDSNIFGNDIFLLDEIDLISISGVLLSLDYATSGMNENKRNTTIINQSNLNTDNTDQSF